MAQVTIYYALEEIKTLDKRIEKALYGSQEKIERENPLLAATIKANAKDVVEGTYVSEDTFVKNADAKIQSIQDLIKRKETIMRLISVSNAQTKITVCGEEMTMVEALQYRNKISEDRKKLVDYLKEQLYNARIRMENESIKDAQNFQSFLENMSISKDKNSAEYKDGEERFYKKNGHKIVTATNLEQLIEKLEEEDYRKSKDVEAGINASNAITLINIPD